jgi:hypothetical protein
MEINNHIPQHRVPCYFRPELLIAHDTSKLFLAARFVRFRALIAHWDFLWVSKSNRKKSVLKRIVPQIVSI